MSRFDLDRAVEVFRKYFNHDLNLDYRDPMTASTELNDRPIEIDLDAAITRIFGNNNIYYYFRNRTVILRTIHKEFVEDMLRNICEGKPTKLALRGFSGVGKTTSLLIISHIAKEMNILVFPIDARSFTNILDSKANEFLSDLRDDNTELISTHLKDLETKLNAVERSNALDTMIEIIEYLKDQTTVPVLFIVDECDKFYRKHEIRRSYKDEVVIIDEPSKHPIGRYFSNGVEEFDVKYGGALFSYSAMFDFQAAKISCKSKEIDAFSPNEWSKLIEINSNFRNEPAISGPDCFGFGVDELGALLGYLPGEFRRFQSTCDKSKANRISNKNYLRHEYLMNASMRFKYQLSKLFEQSSDDERKILNGRIGMRMFFEFDVTQLTDFWQSSLLCVKKDSRTSQTGFTYRFSCPAIRRAYQEIIDEQDQKCRDFKKSCRAIGGHSRAQATLLKMFFSFKCEMALTTSSSREPATISFTGQSFAKGQPDRHFNLTFSRILKDVDLANPNPNDWKAGTVLIFKERNPEVNFAIINADRSVYLFQASYLCYDDNDAKPFALFKKKNKLYESIYDKIMDVLGREPYPDPNDANSGNHFTRNEFYIYLQPTPANKRKVVSSFLDDSSVTNNSKKRKRSLSSNDSTTSLEINSTHSQQQSLPAAAAASAAATTSADRSQQKPSSKLLK